MLRTFSKLLATQMVAKAAQMRRISVASSSRKLGPFRIQEAVMRLSAAHIMWEERMEGRSIRAPYLWEVCIATDAAAAKRAYALPASDQKQNK
jgi:hypothetical protein